MKKKANDRSRTRRIKPSDFQKASLPLFTVYAGVHSFRERRKIVITPDRETMGFFVNLGDVVRYTIRGLPGARRCIKKNQFNMIYLPKVLCEFILPRGDFTVLLVLFKRSYLKSVASTYPALAGFVEATEQSAAPALMVRAHLYVAPREQRIIRDSLIQHVHPDGQAHNHQLTANMLQVFFACLNRMTASLEQQAVALRYDQEKIQEAETYVRNHLAGHIGLLDLVNISGQNRNKLQEGFKEKHGTTVGDFIIYERLEKAKEFLRDPGVPLEKIIRDIGYSSLHGFIKMFERETGTTPATYRKSLKKPGKDPPAT